MKKILMLLCLVCNLSFAEPINIVVPVSPGGNIDTFARTLSKYLMDNNIDNVVSYHTGASGDIAYNYAMSKKDNVILVGGIGNFLLSHVTQKRENHHLANMNVFGPLAEAQTAFVTGNKGFSSLAKMIEYAKSNPLPCGVSSANTLELLRINNEYHTMFEPVPYRGTSQLKVDLIGNNIKCGYDGAGAYVQDHTAETIRMLGTVNPLVKGVPTINSVLTKYSFQNWFAGAIPKNSNLMDDKNLFVVLNSFGSNAQVVNHLNEAGLIALKLDNNITKKMVIQTEQYRNFMK